MDMETGVPMSSLATRWDAVPGYLNAASLGLPTRATAAAIRSAVDEWQDGRATAPGYDVYVEAARADYARLAGTQPERVAIGSQVSALVGIVASAVPDGAEVVCVDGDFTSVVFPFLAHADRGVTVRHEPLEKLAESIRPGTAVVAYSLVQSSDGRVADTAAIRAAAGAAGATTVCDVTQAAGWLPFSASDHDVTVCAAYKWLCAPRGVAFLTVSPQVTDQLRPINAGWYAGDPVWESIYGPRMQLATDARRFDVSPAWLNWVGAASAIRTFAEADLGAVHDHDVGLADRLCSELGLPPAGSAIVSLEDPHGSLLDRFGEAGLSTAGRAGRVRIGFHVWNDEDDLARVLDVVLGRRPR